MLGHQSKVQEINYTITIGRWRNISRWESRWLTPLIGKNGIVLKVNIPVNIEVSRYFFPEPILGEHGEVNKVNCLTLVQIGSLTPVRF